MNDLYQFSNKNQQNIAYMNIIINDEFFFTGTGDEGINVKMTIAGTVAT